MAPPQIEKIEEQKWNARVAEILSAISAALDALGVAHSHHDLRWKVDGEEINVYVKEEFGERRWDGRARVAFESFGGTQYRESKAAASKLGSKRKSDFDYPAIAAALEARARRQRADRARAAQHDVDAAAARAGLVRLVGHRVEDWRIDDSVLDANDISVAYSRYSLGSGKPSVYTVSLGRCTEEEARTAIDVLKAISDRRKP